MLLRLMLLSCLFFSIKANAQSPEEIIQYNLDEQVNAWNTGDIDGYMNGYWRNDSLVFISVNHATYGWQSVYNNYKKKYHNKDIMGFLSFEDIQITAVSNGEFVVIGKWNLTRKKEMNIGGNFVLLYRLINEEWLIVMDYTN